MIVGSLAFCAITFASAGGGHGYRGTGGGGGGGGGGDGIGGLIQLLFWLIWYHPVIGLPLTVAIIIVVIYAAQKGQSTYQSGVIQRGSRLIDDSDKRADLAALKQADPSFDESQLIDRATVAFKKLQDAWSIQKMELVRAFVSDGVFERFNLQIDEQKSLGYRNQMDDVEVVDVEVAQVFSDRLFDQISLRIVCNADDYNVSLQTGQRIHTNATGAFVEIWTFIRRRGATTQPGKQGLIEGQCPNCGAPVEMNQNANCAHCKALLRSGQYDWVLSEITQESEWQPTEESDVPGVAQLLARDPDLNLQELEDRASVMFWRRSAADRLGTARPLRNVATREFCEKFEKQMRSRPGDGRAYFGDCAVGSVDTLGIIAGEDMDRALLEVRWAGLRFVMQNNRLTRDSGRIFSRTIFVLARKPGVKTEVDRAISSAHCPNCGAPNTGAGQSGACESCGAILNDGSRGWVLWDVMSPAEANALLESMPELEPVMAQEVNGAPSSAGLLSWMVMTAASDGVVSSKEMEMLLGTAQRQSVPREQLDQMIQAALRNQLDAPEPQNTAQARSWLTAMVSEAMADGNFTRQEFELIRATGARAGLSEYDVRMLIKDTRQDLYTAAKDALRNRSGSF